MVISSKSLVAAVVALVTGIIALVRVGRYPRGKTRLGFGIVGVILGALEIIVFLLIAAVLVVVATHP